MDHNNGRPYLLNSWRTYVDSGLTKELVQLVEMSRLPQNEALMRILTFNGLNFQ